MKYSSDFDITLSVLDSNYGSLFENKIIVKILTFHFPTFSNKLILSCVLIPP